MPSTFSGWSKKLLDSLPPYLWLAFEFPAILSRNSGLSRNVLNQLCIGNQHKMGPSGVWSLLLESHTLRFSILQAQVSGSRQGEKSVLGIMFLQSSFNLSFLGFFFAFFLVRGPSGTIGEPGRSRQRFSICRGGHAPTRRCGAVPACALHRACRRRITRDAEVESSADVDVEEREGEEDPLLLSVGEEEYRPSPASPSPAPESEEEEEAKALVENAPGVLTEAVVSAPVPVESDVPLATSEQAALPVTVQLLRLHSLACEPPPAPAPAPPVFKVLFKESQAGRKLERAKEVEVAQEREKERQEHEKERQRELERERERERERKRKHEKDAAQGEDVSAKTEDGLTRTSRWPTRCRWQSCLRWC
ncbi:hypothetical protein B0H14DRAFT_2601286 [Mycena olivaceomarginata]|nr:hypothetical protein B0H14DRAFT_2601286 [Mycena olivaceomarginata]